MAGLENGTSGPRRKGVGADANRLASPARSASVRSGAGAPRPAQPADGHVRNGAALKSSLRLIRRAALGDTTVTRDGIVRLPPPSGLSFVSGHATIDATNVAGVLGEVAVTERALLDGTALGGPVRAVLLVENLGPYQDLDPPDGWLVAHVPSWDTATVRLFLAKPYAVPVVHFGDLDPAGVRIVQHLRQIHPKLKWAVPDFWGDYVEKRALPGEWPDDLDLNGAPALIRDLAHRNLWLEQEVIAVDPDSELHSKRRALGDDSATRAFSGRG